MKVLLVTLYFPPAGGGGVQRPLKFATHLPELGIETHVLAPDDPKWIHRDDELPPPTLAWVHRVKFIGPEGRRPAEELHGTMGLERYTRQASLLGRRLLLPDENVTYNLTAIPAAIKIVREEGIDVVVTTSPPPSIHFIGAAVKRATGARWVADLRDSLVAHPHRDSQKLSVRVKEQGLHAVASLVARQADASVAVSEAIAAEMRTKNPRGPVLTIPNGSDFEDFAGMDYEPSAEQVPDHARGLVLRQARSEAVPDGAVTRGRGRRALRRRLPGRRPRVVGGDHGSHRPRPLRLASPGARATARLRGAAAPDPRRRRSRQGSPLREGLRVPGCRAPDPRGRPVRRRSSRPDPRDRRRRRRRPDGHRRDRTRADRHARPLARGQALRLAALAGVEDEARPPHPRPGARRPPAHLDSPHEPVHTRDASHGLSPDMPEAPSGSRAVAVTLP